MVLFFSYLVICIETEHEIGLLVLVYMGSGYNKKWGAIMPTAS